MTNFFRITIDCFTKKYFYFQSRSSRKEYVCFIFFCWCIGIFLSIIKDITHNRFFFIDIFDCIFFIYTLIPLITVTTRRLNDFNISGIFGILVTITYITLLFFIGYRYIFVIIGLLITLFLMLKKGTPSTNKYGEPPTY